MQIATRGVTENLKSIFLFINGLASDGTMIGRSKALN